MYTKGAFLTTAILDSTASSEGYYEAGLRIEANKVGCGVYYVRGLHSFVVGASLPLLIDT